VGSLATLKNISRSRSRTKYFRIDLLFKHFSFQNFLRRKNYPERNYPECFEKNFRPDKNVSKLFSKIFPRNKKIPAKNFPGKFSKNIFRPRPARKKSRPQDPVATP